MSALLDLVKSLDDFGPKQVDAYFMGCAHCGELRIRIDHNTKTITSIDEPLPTPARYPAWQASSSARDIPVQPSSTKVMHTRLSMLARVLHNTVNSEPVLSPEGEVAHQATQFTKLITATNAERRALSLRKTLIACQHEPLSEFSMRKEKEEASHQAELMRAKKLIEEQKEKEDAKKEIEHARQEIESIRKEEAKKLAQDLIKCSGLKVSLAVGPLHAYLDRS